MENSADSLACGFCGTVNPQGARFCKGCGASLRAPKSCPSCQGSVPTDAKFCPHCGLQLVGQRPESAEVASPSGKEPKPPTEELEKIRQSMPAIKPTASSSMMGNVLVFFAFLAVLVVVIYSMNKNAKKTISPFEGGPPPSQAGEVSQKQQPAPEPSPEDPALALIGTVKLADTLKGEDLGGTLYVIVRNAGMPNRGPPVAVKKVDQPSFPQRFSITRENVMLEGMPFDGPFDVYVRLDKDGNAMTKAPGDLFHPEPAENVKPGDSFSIVLNQKL